MGAYTVIKVIEDFDGKASKILLVEKNRGRRRHCHLCDLPLEKGDRFIIIAGASYVNLCLVCARKLGDKIAFADDTGYAATVAKKVMLDL
jgi:hypothetical protein